MAYRKSVDIQASFVQGLERLGRIKLDQRKYSDAGVFFQQAVDIDRSRIAGLLPDTTGVVDTADNKATSKPMASSADIAATETIVSAAASEAKSPVDYHSPFYAYTGLGVIADLNENRQQAIDYYSLSLKIRPSSAVAENNMGYSHYLNNDLSTAEKHFKRAIAKDKTYAKPYKNLALIYVRQQHYKKAENLLLGHSPNKAEAYNTVGYICMIDGKHDKAERYFNRAIEESPVFYDIAVENRDLNRDLYSSSVFEALN